ncbi:hypothetical protein ACGFNV_06440 [Streptomyces sp. NPDC048751]|uniref:hypothetical protein n=1 Tax=Streptomyces sp. NPDC048751 TaxID=3365591 RepID=UPI003711598C
MSGGVRDESRGVRDESPAGTARVGAQNNAAHDSGTQYITGGGDVKSVNLFFNRPSSDPDSGGSPGAGGKLSAKMRAALVGSGFGVVTLAAALTVYATNAPRTSDTANTHGTRPSTAASASPARSASPTPSPSPSPSPTPPAAPAAPPVAAPARTTEPAAPGPSAAPSKSAPSTTYSEPYAPTGVYCSAWQRTDSADMVVRACAQAVDGIGRAFFGAEIENRGKETMNASVLVKYVVSRKSLACPRKPDPWTGIVIKPGDRWRSALPECQVDDLKGHAVQSQAWAVTQSREPSGLRMASSPSLDIQSSGTVVPRST